MVATELVANAVRHSGGTAADWLTVRVTRAQKILGISVHDPGVSRQEAALGNGDPMKPGGWGLRIVAQLSVRWGVERPDGYRVWAELPTHR